MKTAIAIISYLLFTLSAYALDLKTPAPVDMISHSKPPSKDMYFASEIYPVGWSKDGHFAFVQKNEVAGRGGIKFSYFIIDSVTDKVAWNYIDDWIDSNNTTIHQSIKKSKNRFKKQLEKYEIVQNRGIDLHAFPLNHGDQKFFPEIEILKKKESHPFLGDIKSVSIFMNKNTKRKRIFLKKDPGAFSYWITGYFASPFEKRILVGIGEEKWGHEGTEGHIIFSGCSLKSGYK